MPFFLFIEFSLKYAMSCINVTREPKGLICSGVLWRITTVTGDEEGGAAEGPATVVLYGDKGKSCPTKFGTDPNFEFAKDGPKDEMEITVRLIYYFVCFLFF